jgi:nucleoside-diphosphate-sugar epimerase
VWAAGIEELDAVVSTVGGTVADPTADGEGNINLINAAIEKGVKKFVLVTSIGTGDSKDAPSEVVYNVLKPVLKEKEKAEEALKVRAAALVNVFLPLIVGTYRVPKAELQDR